MDRTKFLKTFGMMAAGTVLARGGSLGPILRQPVNPTLLPATQPRFREENPGKILVSKNEGATWLLHANLGPEITVLNITTTPQGTSAYVDFKGLHFTLELSADGKSWLVP